MNFLLIFSEIRKSPERETCFCFRAKDTVDPVMISLQIFKNLYKVIPYSSVEAILNTSSDV